MRHRDHGVELAHVPGRMARAHEHGIGRIGAAGIDAFGARGLHGRRDEETLFVAKEPAFASMRVEPGHGDARRLDAERNQRLLRDAQRLPDRVEAQRVDGVAQREVDRHQHHPQLVIGQHHAHWRQRATLRGQGLQHFRVPWEGDACCRQRFFVDRCGDDRSALPRLHQLHRMLNAARSGRAVLGVDAAPGQARERAVQPRGCAYGQATWWQVRSVARHVDHRHAGEAFGPQGAGTAHHRDVANHHGVAQRAGVERCGNDLGANSRSVAHRHQQRLARHAGL